jgi:guanosine-3',5'-bis(diphosphate) 3'-pyrophosphohydrolase
MVPERFKDFISTPKSNNYRSLHTTVVGPGGLRIEMQIRTEAMDRVAEDGVAAHWAYKNKSYGFDKEGHGEGGRARSAAEPAPPRSGHRARRGRRGLGRARQAGDVPRSGLRLHAEGPLITLPRGGMPLDFAYAVHTEVGDTAVGVKINGELKPMRTPLQNGDVVEIIRGAKREIPPTGAA